MPKHLDFLGDYSIILAHRFVGISLHKFDATQMTIIPTQHPQRRFGGISRLYGDAALQRFQAAHVCVVGVGGVGSWAVEALARSGVGQLTLIDLDNVAESNVNRQLPALTSQFGKAKVAALAERITDINAACTVHQVEDFVDADNLKQLFHQPFDFVIDAIDQVRTKAAMAAHFVSTQQAFAVSGGAGGQKKCGLNSARRLEPCHTRSDAGQYALYLAQTPWL